MSYTARVDDVKVELHGDKVSITTREPGWGGANEPAYHEHTVKISVGSLPNLIEAFNDIRNAKRNEW